jgi:MinD-like ATPase involved in chromosome partitioning or flagellar assembly
VDALIGEREWLERIDANSGKIGKLIALVEDPGQEKENGHWMEILQYQSLPALLYAIRKAMGMEGPGSSEGCQVWTVFSASGGVGKTTVGLNLVRQATDRGLRVFYLNLEELNATSLLFGKGEPDGLSRLMYALQARPEQWEELAAELCRHQPQLRTDYIDAPEHPGERLAMTPELTAELIGKLRDSRRYDLIVIDPDSGASAWHRGLLDTSDKLIWLTIDDAQNLLKAEKLLRYWKEALKEKAYKLKFVMNKGNGGRLVNRWALPGTSPAFVLPYIAQWKTVDQPGRLLASPVFSGAIAELLDFIRSEDGSASLRSRKEEGGGDMRSYTRGAG